MQYKCCLECTQCGLNYLFCGRHVKIGLDFLLGTTADGTAETLLGCTNGQAEKQSVGRVWWVFGSTREPNCCSVKQRNGTSQVPVVQCRHFLLFFSSLPWSWRFCQASVQSHAAAASSQPSFQWRSQQGKLMGGSKM